MGPFFRGSIINVSGKVDSDKEGGVYRSYFPNAAKYCVSNYNVKEKVREEKRWDFDINLDEELDPQFIGEFDVVFNHTTLEHIFDLQRAFTNLCAMTKDIVIVVVPFLQQMHFGASYKDYWRFTPYALKEMFQREGMKLLYISGNNKSRESIYLFAIGSKKPHLWENVLPRFDQKIFDDLGDKII